MRPRGVAATAARHLAHSSLYNLKLLRRGVHVQLGRDVALFSEIGGSTAMTTEVVTIPPNVSARAVLHLIAQTSHYGFPFVDAGGMMHGMITTEDMRHTSMEGRLDQPVSALGSHTLIVALPQYTLNDAPQKLGLYDVGRIPVVDPDHHRGLLGTLTCGDIIKAYDKALIRQHTNLPQTDEAERFD